MKQIQPHDAQRLLEACRLTLDTLNGMTTEQFSSGADKPSRLALSSAIYNAEANAGCNGWTNYETWLVKLWMDNEEDPQRYWQHRARAAFSTATASATLTKIERARLELAEELQTWHEGSVHYTERANTPGWTSDLLMAALAVVDWREIAGNLLEGIDNAAPRETQP